jgi:hypothetical protein
MMLRNGGITETVIATLLFHNSLQVKLSGTLAMATVLYTIAFAIVPVTVTFPGTHIPIVILIRSYRS